MRRIFPSTLVYTCSYMRRVVPVTVVYICSCMRRVFPSTVVYICPCMRHVFPSTLVYTCLCIRDCACVAFSHLLWFTLAHACTFVHALRFPTYCDLHLPKHARLCMRHLPSTVVYTCSCTCSYACVVLSYSLWFTLAYAYVVAHANIISPTEVYISLCMRSCARIT